jgi:flagellar basal body-associated protein FliL
LSSDIIIIIIIIIIVVVVVVRTLYYYVLAAAAAQVYHYRVPFIFYTHTVAERPSPCAIAPGVLQRAVHDTARRHTVRRV